MKSLSEKRKIHAQGLRAENFAAWSLRLKGWRILAQRWVCYQGEIDLVAQRGDMVIFVEVKYRQSFEKALDALTSAQWQRIEASADIFMSRYPSLHHCVWRLDAICVCPWHWPRHFKNMWGEHVV